MPRIIPEALKPYHFHGVEFEWREGDEEAVGDCPFCGREEKFCINSETGQWQCFVCREGTDKGGGNATVFVRKLHDLSYEGTPTSAYGKLAEQRRLLFPEILVEWGWCESIITGRWMVPGLDAEGAVRTLYVYGDKLYPTPTLGHWLMGPARDADKIYLTEGPWDGMALEEVLGRCKESDENLLRTSDRELSLLNGASVRAVPGCGSVGEPMKKWASLFSDREIILAFDSDHPREVNGKTVAPAAIEATKRAVGILYGVSPLPTKVEYLWWGPDGYDPALPSGYDVRDELSGIGPPRDLEQRIAALEGLLGRIRLVPPEWAGKEPRRGSRASGETYGPDCRSYADLVKAWRRAMRWTEGLDCALSAMLASVISTNLIGEQLWFEVIGPPSSGKTTIMEGVSTNKKYVVSKDTIRGFYSGWRGDGGQDTSLMTEISGMTLAMKEGDAFVKAPNIQQILSEGRGIYDRVGRNHYRNATANEYEGHRMTWLICGTSAIREEIDSSELGARFLACVVMDEIDDDFEDDVLWRAVNQESRSMLVESNGDPRTQHPEELAKAMAMTGNYVSYLRQNAAELVSQVHLDDNLLRRCSRMGKFVAYMRARPSKKDERQEREFGARLAKQITRLHKSLAAVVNRPGDDPDIMRRTRKIVMDTADGMALDISRLLFERPDGMDGGAIVLRLNQPSERINKLLRFLRQIGALDLELVEVNGKKNAQKRFILTERIRKLYQEVVG